MSYGLPEDWYIEESGETLILDQEKVAAEIDRLRKANEHNEQVIRACNRKISELELWNRDYREQVAFWKAKAEGPAFDR